MSQRGGEDGGEHEASRRMKTELLIQMDGLAKSDDLVFVLAVSNLPWILDTALLRRLEKRIFVPLPSKEARHQMFQYLLKGRIDSSVNPLALAEQTEGYSGSDIHVVCKEGAMAPVRRLLERIEKGEQNLSLTDVQSVALTDIEAALKRTKPSAQKVSQQYLEWQDQFGSL